MDVLVSCHSYLFSSARAQLRILAYVNVYLPTHCAGAETTMHDILKFLVGRGHTVRVLLAITKPNVPHEPYVIDGVEVIPFDPLDKRRLNEEAPQWDIVVTHLEPSERAAIVCAYSNTPVVHVVHNTLWQTEGYLSTGCNLAIYNSLWVAAHHEGEDRANLGLVALSKDESHVDSRVEFRTRTSWKWPYVIVHPAILPSDYSTDGPHDCITLVNAHINKGPKIFYEMARTFTRENFLLVKGGYGVQELQAAPPNVEVIENTPNVRELVYARTKILLMPSEYESFGRAAIEAAASGIPTIASPTPGLREALGPQGIYADPTNPDEWEEALATLLKPRNYAAASKRAKARSKYWADIRAPQLDALEKALIDLIRK